MNFSKAFAWGVTNAAEKLGKVFPFFKISQGTYTPTLERVPLCYRPNNRKPKRAKNNWKMMHRLCAQRHGQGDILRERKL